MVEGARLESEYTSKAYRGFESLPLRHMLRKTGNAQGCRAIRPKYHDPRHFDVAIPCLLFAHILRTKIFRWRPAFVHLFQTVGYSVLIGKFTWTWCSLSLQNVLLVGRQARVSLDLSGLLAVIF